MNHTTSQFLGHEVVTLASEGVGSVTVAPTRGALIASLQIGNRELLYLDESTFTDSTKNVRGGIPVLFPSPGKLLDDMWAQAGRTGVMKQHGFARNLPWSVAEQQDALLLRLQDTAATHAQFPWRFEMQMQLAWRGERLRVTTRVRNTDQTMMPYALGFHPYFQVSDKSSAEIATAAQTVYNNVSKQQEVFAGFNFLQPEVDLHLLDHASKSLGNGCFLELFDGEGVELSASADFAVWVVWALQGKDFICVEPWTAPGNALNTGRGLTALAPGEFRESWYEIGWRKL
jgi:galactose mutarotase-like enzyme